MHEQGSHFLQLQEHGSQPGWWWWVPAGSGTQPSAKKMHTSWYVDGSSLYVVAKIDNLRSPGRFWGGRSRLHWHFCRHDTVHGPQRRDSAQNCALIRLKIQTHSALHCCCWITNRKHQMGSLAGAPLLQFSRSVLFSCSGSAGGCKGVLQATSTLSRYAAQNCGTAAVHMQQQTRSCGRTRVVTFPQQLIQSMNLQKPLQHTHV